MQKSARNLLTAPIAAGSVPKYKMFTFRRRQLAIPPCSAQSQHSPSAPLPTAFRSASPDLRCAPPAALVPAPAGPSVLLANQVEAARVESIIKPFSCRVPAATGARKKRRFFTVIAGRFTGVLSQIRREVTRKNVGPLSGEELKCRS